MAPKPWPTDIPTALQQRDSLPDCGEYDATAYGALGFGKLPAAEQAKQDCFWNAYKTKASAELRVISVTSIEGDVRPVYYRTYSDGRNVQLTLNANGEVGIRNCPAFINRDPLVPTCE